MSARDELADVIAWRYHAANPRPTVLDGAVADAILAAGYSKPRTITTVAELEDAPASTVFLAGDHVYRKERGALCEPGIGLLGYAEVLEEEGSLLLVWAPAA